MKIRRKYLFYILILTSSIISAVVAAIDTTISALYVTNPLHFSISVFLVGILISFLIIFLFSIPVRNKSLGSLLIDPSFRRVRLPKKEELGYLVNELKTGRTITVKGFDCNCGDLDKNHALQAVELILRNIDDELTSTKKKFAEL